jgi:uncharacterized protein (TIGR04255 family)
MLVLSPPPTAVPEGTMSFILGKPPVVEAWAQATMTPTPESEWDWEKAEGFLRLCKQEGEVLEFLPEWTPEAQEAIQGKRLGPIELTVEPRYVRVRSKDRSRVVQVGQNELIVVQGRDPKSGFAGFEALSASFLESVEKYGNNLGSQGVDSVELHYVDLVVVPDLYNTGLSLPEYFEGAPNLPAEKYGPVMRVAWSYKLACPNKIDYAELTVKLLPPDNEDNDGRFRLDWHAWCPNVASPDLTVAETRLRAAHDYLKSSFKELCLPPIWTLFDPKES